jgi:hypothetical protein
MAFKNIYPSIPDGELILPATVGPGVYSASNRNEYWKH